jgi:hypothetical protein
MSFTTPSFSRLLLLSGIVAILLLAAEAWKLDKVWYNALNTIKKTEKSGATQNPLPDSLNWKYRFSAFETGVFNLSPDGKTKAGIGYVIELSATGEVQVLRTFPATFGTVDGMKSREGDRKTPHGFYFIKGIHEKDRQANIFGGLFLELNYPNADDVAAGRTGSGIGIHGGRYLPTRGCIRILDDNWKPGLSNIRLFKEMSSKGMAVVIVPRLKPELRGPSGSRLHPGAWRTWYDLLKKPDIARDSILAHISS